MGAVDEVRVHRVPWIMEQVLNLTARVRGNAGRAEVSPGEV